MGILIGAIAGIAVAMIIGATADIVATTVAPDSKTGHGQEREAAPPLVKKHLLIAIREDALQVLMAASKIDALWDTIPEENKEVATTLGARKYWEEQLSRVERERHPHPEASELRAEIKWLQEVLKALQQKHEECLAFLHDLQLELTYQPQNFFSKSSRSNYS
ncbi:hypothetical protein AMD26_019080 [Deinococcus sp. UR1]|nr:hypothetical protein AMD26_019080 [Deinococcus sp. UR1]